MGNNYMKAVYYVIQGNLLDNLGKYKEAIECFDKAIRNDRKNKYAYNNKGYSLDN